MVFWCKLQLFIEQLESVLQGNEGSIRFVDVTINILFYCTYKKSGLRVRLTVFLLIMIVALAHYCFQFICFGLSQEELVARCRDQSVSDYGEDNN